MSDSEVPLEPTGIYGTEVSVIPSSCTWLICDRCGYKYQNSNICPFCGYNPVGWMCPRCKKVYAPWVYSCDCKEKES